MPDPSDFSAVLVMKGYAGLRSDALRVSTKLEQDGQILAAREIRAAMVELTEELTFIARDVAQLAEQAILEEEQTSRVRPDTQGDGGPRLEDFVGESVPFPEVPGTVLVNNEKTMADNVPWWWTNEEGYSGFIGRKLQGYFFDAGWSGKSRPSVDRSREHPLFRGRMVKGAAKGAVIKNPIPERRFVEHGLETATVEWHALVQAARARFDIRVQRASLLARQPRVP